MDGPGADWLQRLIAACLTLGISKRALFEDYYLDEIGMVANALAQLRSNQVDPEKEALSAEGFFGF